MSGLGKSYRSPVFPDPTTSVGTGGRQSGLALTGIKPAPNGFITKAWAGFSWCRIQKIQYGCGLIIWADGIGLPKIFIHSYTTITLPPGYGSIQLSLEQMELVCSSAIPTVKHRGTGNPDKA